MYNSQMSKQGFWDENLQLLQQEYWRRWSELVRAASGGESALPVDSPWEMSLAHWWQAVSPAVPPVARDFMVRMMEQGRQFFRMADIFTTAAHAAGEEPDWKDLLDRIPTDPFSTSGSVTEAVGDGPTQKVMGFWDLPLHSWERLAMSLLSLSGDLFGNVIPGVPMEVGRFFSVPGTGFSREEQADQQRLLQLLHKYLQALQEYRRFFSRIGRESTARLRDTLDHLAAKGEVIDTARRLYDLWAVTCEEVYIEWVSSADYARINGDLVNSFIAVKRLMSKLLDARLDALNMPTRRELRAVQARMQENRRENRRLCLELEALKRVMAAAPNKSEQPGSAPVKSSHKSPARKKSTPVISAALKNAGTGSNETN